VEGKKLFPEFLSMEEGEGGSAKAFQEMGGDERQLLGGPWKGELISMEK